MDLIPAHRDYTTRVVGLMIWYARELSRRRPPVPVEVALEQHVDIMRKTSLFDGRHPADGLDPPIPAWDALRRDLASLIEGQDGSSSEALEDACWDRLAPLSSRTSRAPRRPDIPTDAGPT